MMGILMQTLSCFDDSLFQVMKNIYKFINFADSADFLIYHQQA